MRQGLQGPKELSMRLLCSGAGIRGVDLSLGLRIRFPLPASPFPLLCPVPKPEPTPARLATPVQQLEGKYWEGMAAVAGSVPLLLATLAPGAAGGLPPQHEVAGCAQALVTALSRGRGGLAFRATALAALQQVLTKGLGLEPRPSDAGRADSGQGDPGAAATARHPTEALPQAEQLDAQLAELALRWDATAAEQPVGAGTTAGEAWMQVRARRVPFGGGRGGRRGGLTEGLKGNGGLRLRQADRGSLGRPCPGPFSSAPGRLCCIPTRPPGMLQPWMFTGRALPLPCLKWSSPLLRDPLACCRIFRAV